jgi:hypothetical protein
MQYHIGSQNFEMFTSVISKSIAFGWAVTIWWLKLMNALLHRKKEGVEDVYEDSIGGCLERQNAEPTVHSLGFAVEEPPLDFERRKG